eukprot:TRINITY_DN11262_c0_g1_i3.p1 TRINITY_DN11262_c0_g1~~TRINITY_DN11262_c0_g1_i3.p1  ORF type:complete len:703 (+),score=71.81 TRINITY_DN11262_c0_g1_i3:233-2341(+)
MPMQPRFMRGGTDTGLAQAMSDANDRDSVRRTSLVDVEAQMTEKMRSFEIDLARINIHHILGGSVGRTKVDSLLEGSKYQLFVAACTLVSVGLAAIETDIIVAGVERTRAVWMSGLSVLTVFAVDVVFRLYAYRSHFFRSSLNILEASLLLLDGLLELSSYLPEMLGVLIVLKILRFVRLARLLRSHAKTRELFLMIMGIVASIRALIFGAMLLIITLTVFSILAVYFVRPVNRRLAEQGAFGDCSLCEDAFDSVMNANIHFLTTIVAGDSWGLQAVPLIREDTAAAIIIIGALLVTHLGLLNTIAAVIVDRQVQARADDSAFMAAVASDELRESLTLLQTIFKQMGDSGNESISLNEVEEFYDASAIFRSILNQLDIHKPDLPVIFKILDTDNTGDLTFTEFVNGLHSIKNENMHTLMVFTRHYCETIFTRLPDVGKLLTHQTKHMDARLREVIRCVARLDKDTNMAAVSCPSCDSTEIPTLVNDVPGESDESARKCMVKQISGSSFASSRKGVFRIGKVAANPDVSGDSDKDKQAASSHTSRPSVESSAHVELPSPPTVVSTGDVKANGSSKRVQLLARSASCVVSARTTPPAGLAACVADLSPSSSTTLEPSTKLAPICAVASIADIASAGDEHFSASSFVGLKPPARSATCAAVSAPLSVVTAGINPVDVHHAQPQRLGNITHAPVGRRPPRPRRLQE